MMIITNSEFKNRLLNIAHEGLRLTDISIDDIESCLRIKHGHHIMSGTGTIQPKKKDWEEASIHVDGKLKDKIEWLTKEDKERGVLSLDIYGRSNLWWQTRSREEKEKLYKYYWVKVFVKKTRISAAEVIFVECNYDKAPRLLRLASSPRQDVA